MYRNIVFDLGGVVVNYSPRDYLVDRFFNERVEKKIYDAVFGSEEWLLLDKNALSWHDAARIFMKRGRDKDIAFEMQAVMDDWTDMLTDRNATIALMRLMKKRDYNLYYLSNISRRAYELLEKRPFWKLFSGGVASCEVNINKPDLGIYKALLEKYSLVPEETIFTDDNKDNAVAAFDAGITGVQFTNVKTFVRQLADYGIDL